MHVRAEGGRWGAARGLLGAARRGVVPLLAAAAMESYSRAYPFIARLHVLHDLSECMPVLRATRSGDASGAGLAEGVEGLHWDARHRLMAASHKSRALSTHTQRCVLGLLAGEGGGAHARGLLAQSWLVESRECATGQVAAASFALRNAQQHGLDADAVLLEECGLLQRLGQQYRALVLLEPSETDAAHLDMQIANGEGATVYRTSCHIFGIDWGGMMIAGERDRVKLAERLLLATQLIVEVHSFIARQTLQ